MNELPQTQQSNQQLFVFKKLAAESTPVLFPRMQNIRPFQRVFFNGEWQILPLIVNQRINRVLSRSPIAAEEKPTPVEKEKIFIPTKRLAQRMKPAIPEITPPPLPRTVRYGAPPKKVPSKVEIEAEITSPTARELERLKQELAQKEAQLYEKKEREKVLDEAIESYKKQIESLTLENKNFEEKINQTQSQLGNLKESVNRLSEQNRQKEERSQKLKEHLGKLRSSLGSSISYIETLKQKMSEKEKALEKLRVTAQEKLVEASAIEAEKKTAESIVKNLRQALKNAREELERLKTEEGREEELRIKGEQIQRLTLRLKEKEAQAEEASVLASQLQKAREEEERLVQGVASYQAQIAELTGKKQELFATVKEEEEKLSKLRESLEEVSAENKEKEALILEQQKKLEQLAQDKEKISLFAQELSERLFKIKGLKRMEKAIKVEVERPEKVAKPKLKVVKAKKVSPQKPSLTKLFNAINGVVKDDKGKLLENAVVIIKTADDEPLRALRTNDLGQFLLSSPMSNGVYHIETTFGNLKFDIIEIELSGEVLPPLEITAHA